MSFFGFFRLAAVVGLIAGIAVGEASARTILFVGNSFTYGQNAPVKHYKAETVTDLNGEGIGGVPALFAAFSREAGLDWTVSLETSPGKGLDWHWNARRTLLDRPWDAVVLQSFSTLDAAHPGDPTLLVDYVQKFAGLFQARNARVQLYLDATWSRPDMTYPPGTPWHGKPITAMAEDVAAGYGLAAAKSTGVTGVLPVGLAFNRAIATGFADPDPYDGTTFGQVDLWSWDHYHASAYGYYLEALVIFGRVTGRDPVSLGAYEKSADDMGFSTAQTLALERIAHEELAAH